MKITERDLLQNASDDDYLHIVHDAGSGLSSYKIKVSDFKKLFMNADDYTEGDFIRVEGGLFVPKTVSEIKTLLGIPISILVGLVSSINIDGVGIVTSAITKNIDTFSSAESAEFAWAKIGTGYYRLTLPTAYDALDGNTIINAFAVTVPSGYEIIFTYTNTYIQVNLYESGVLTDLNIGDSFAVTFEIKAYE